VITWDLRSSRDDVRAPCATARNSLVTVSFCPLLSFGTVTPKGIAAVIGTNDSRKRPLSKWLPGPPMGSRRVPEPPWVSWRLE
jgi:hypothetical protein